MAKFIAKSPMIHNGKFYGVDDTVELDGRASDALLSLGLVEPVAEPKARKAGDKPASQDKAD